MKNRLIGVMITAIAGLGVAFWLARAESAVHSGVMYKNPSCMCCDRWAEHLDDNGIAVEVRTEGLQEVKRKNGITPDLAGCHTAIIEGYVIEGHVPADVIGRLLGERPDVIGVAVPGMPVGSPGMESSHGHVESYDVLAFDADGNTRVYESH